MLWDIPLAILDQLSGCVPSLLPVEPQLLTSRAAWGAEISLAVCKHSSARTTTSVCDQCYFHLKSKRSTIPSTRMKVNSVTTGSRIFSSVLEIGIYSNMFITLVEVLLPV